MPPQMSEVTLKLEVGGFWALGGSPVEMLQEPW